MELSLNLDEIEFYTSKDVMKIEKQKQRRRIKRKIDEQ